MARPMPLGPVIAAIAGTSLTVDDRARLLHPLVGGLTLFVRNYDDPAQLAALCAQIHALREPALLICVDHEGGRVQRFRDGFTLLPAMRRLGMLWDRDRVGAISCARAAGLVMAAELRSCGVDLSFAPVLDLDYGASTIIGDRAFHSDPRAVAELAASLLEGMHAAGMVGVGKHFPGHGYIAADSHLELPVDERPLDEIERRDLQPFAALCAKLAGVMPAHVLYPAVDARPAGFSEHWLKQVLRKRCRFEGAIFSDDLGMQGAAGEGGLKARAAAAFAAGCDLVLACTPEDADALLADWTLRVPAMTAPRLAAMFGPQSALRSGVAHSQTLAQARAKLAALA